jgi:hypothetical protein
MSEQAEGQATMRMQTKQEARKKLKKPTEPRHITRAVTHNVPTLQEWCIQADF